MPEEIGALSDALGNASAGIPQSEYGGALGLSAVASLMQIPRYRQDQTPYLSIRGATFSLRSTMRLMEASPYRTTADWSRMDNEFK